MEMMLIPLALTPMPVSNSDGSLTGIWVSSVKSGSAADDAGLKPGRSGYHTGRFNFG